MGVISVTNLLTGADSTDQETPYTTAAVTPTANSALLVSWGTSKSANPPTITVAGLGLAWTTVGTAAVGPANRRCGAAYAVIGASPPAAGILSLTPNSEASGCAWSVEQVTGGDLYNPIVVGSVKTANDGGTPGGSLAVTLNPPGRGDSRPFVVWLVDDADNNATPKSTWLESSEVHYTPSGTGIAVHWRSVQFDTAASVTWSGSPTNSMAGLAFELAGGSLVDYQTEMWRIQERIATQFGSDISKSNLEDRVLGASAMGVVAGIVRVLVTQGVMTENQFYDSMRAVLGTAFASMYVDPPPVVEALPAFVTSRRRTQVTRRDRVSRPVT